MDGDGELRRKPNFAYEMRPGLKKGFVRIAARMTRVSEGIGLGERFVRLQGKVFNQTHRLLSKVPVENR